MPQFLNIDFEFFADYNLAEIALILNNKILILYNGWLNEQHYLCFELLKEDDIHETFNNFFQLLQTLDRHQLKKLLLCTTKVMDVGFKTAHEAKNFTCSSELLKKIADYDFDLKFTFYND